MPSTRTPKQGEVWIAYLDPIAGREQGGVRPVLVVSNNAFNALPHDLCMVVPLTRTDRNLLTHVRLLAPEGGLRDDSVAMCDQIRTISLERIRSFRGTVTNESLQAILSTLSRFLR